MYLEDETVTPCIDATLGCYRACLGLVSTRRLSLDNAFADSLFSCAETCQSMADQLIRGSGETTNALLKCAKVTDQCAADCETRGGMEECAAVCRWCAAACRELSEAKPD